MYFGCGLDASDIADLRDLHFWIYRLDFRFIFVRYSIPSKHLSPIHLSKIAFLWTDFIII